MKNLPAIPSAMTELRADYAAAQESKFRRRRTALHGAADAHYASEYRFIKVREYVRDMDRNDAVIGTTVDKAVQQHIQGGLWPDPSTGDRKLDRDLWARWDEWSHDPEQCDVMGEMEFPDMEEHVLRAEIIDGDIFALPLRDGSLQLMESDRARTPQYSRRNVVHGVELDGLRKRQAFYFTKDDIDPFVRIKRVSDMTRVAARDADGFKQVFHVYDPKRVSQSRGITAFHAIFDIEGMWEDTNFALLVKQQIAACFGAFVEQTGDGPAADVPLGQRTPAPDGSTNLDEGLSPGLIVRLKKGQKATAYSPQIPSTEAMQHMRFLLQLIGVNIGMPLVLVLMDASETNFSGWRGALDQARLGFRRNQKRLVRRFHKPVYNWKLRQWTAEDPALARAMERLGVAFFSCRWHAPTWPYIQPLDDAKADGFRLDRLLASPRQVAAERGRDYDDIVDETISDNARLIRRAIQASKFLKKKEGVDVSWRDVINPTAGNKTTQVTEDDAADRKGEGPAPRSKAAE